MAFIQYLTFDGTELPLPDSYEVQMDDVEADSRGDGGWDGAAGCGARRRGEHPRDVFRVGKMAEDFDGV